MNELGIRLRELREANNLLLRQVAAHLDTDTAHVSKIERGERKAKREQVVKIAMLLNVNPTDLLTLWLADQIYELVFSEEIALQSLNLVIEKIKK